MPRRDFHKQRRIKPTNIFHTFAQSPHVENENAGRRRRNALAAGSSIGRLIDSQGSSFFFRRARTSRTSTRSSRHVASATLYRRRRRQTDNPKYRRAVLPREHAAIGRQFVLKSRAIGIGIGPVDLGQAVATH